MADAYANLLIERHADGYAVVTLNRPEALNALNAALFKDLADFLDSVEQDDSVRCLILTGSGEKAFAAGADIKEMADQTYAQMGDPGLAGGQGQKQIFGSPVHAFDRRPLQPLNEAFRERKAQVGPVDPHPRQTRARQHRRQAAPDGFDLGKFRHGALLAGLGT